MKVLDWLDTHAHGLMAIGALGALVTGAGSWFCTVMADRRAFRRSEQMHRLLTVIGLHQNKRDNK